jgi:hypothetical protein
MMHNSYLLETDGTRQKPGDDPKKLRGSRTGKTIYRSRDYKVNDDQQGKENENDLDKSEKLSLGCRIHDITPPSKSIAPMGYLPAYFPSVHENLGVLSSVNRSTVDQGIAAKSAAEILRGAAGFF